MVVLSYLVFDAATYVWSAQWQQANWVARCSHAMSCFSLAGVVIACYRSFKAAKSSSRRDGEVMLMFW